MSTIANFIKTILPTTERASVRTSIVNTQQEFDCFNKPLFKDATKEFGGWSFKSDFGKSFDKDLAIASIVKSRGNAIALIDAINKTLDPLFVDLLKMLDEHFGEDFSNDSITVQRYNILQLIEAVMFYTDYSRRWLNVVLRKENNIVTKAVAGENDGILPVDIKWLAEQRDTFLKVVHILTNKPEKISNMIENLPEFTIQPNAAMALKQKDVDPLGFGFISTTMNPFFALRMIRARWQIAKYQAAELEYQELEFRIIALRASIDGKPDAKKEALANTLEEKRLRPLRAQLAQWEEEYTNV